MTDDKPDTKQKILAAADAEFLERGYEGSRMQAIADRAGINKALLHYYFSTKDELFAQVFRDKAQLLFPRIEAELRGHTDFIAFVCRFVDLYIAHLIEHPFLPFYLLQVSTTRAELFKELTLAFPQRFAQAFRGAVRAGAVRSHDPLQFITSLLGMCIMPFVGKHLVKHLFELDEAAYQTLLRRRAGELKRYVVLLLTPDAASSEER